MPSGAPVALILGAGANVGQHVSRAFASKGYRVAIAARSLREEDSTPDQLQIRADFTDPESLAALFDKVGSEIGAPHVVVYNAASVKPHDEKDPLGVALHDFTRDLAVNTTSLFAAAQQAARAFKALPKSASRTFIYTGNCCNEVPFVGLMDLGVGKSASAHVIQCAAIAYREDGFKFYYADERNADGSPAFMAIDGPAHGEFYTELAEGTAQGPWQQTFVKGVGYKKF
ncbi:Uu.00g042350.m01.CDS01 [Anthostomella pinea]|uniref:Uu.00g042350.m01.CDS01 n=1 Tax=Anthostomella pinea TaxID=933095 RepID=A0AAI8VB31_9PEZI|nr:Uu.00g042350.m01.CDS01 [Anthostomella pinea]